MSHGERKRPPTIIDIARAVGVGKSTVSRALRGSPLISEGTKRKVKAAARRLGYRPNMVFSVMGSGNRRGGARDPLPVAYLYDQADDLDPQAPSGDFHFLREAAALYGYVLDPYNLRAVGSARAFGRMLYARGYCGVIIGRILDDASLAYRLDLARFTVIFSTNTSWAHRHHRVIGDVYLAIQMAWDKAVTAGHRRIGVASCRHRPPLPDDEIRVAAVLQRQHRDVGVVTPIPPFEGEPGDLPGFDSWFRKWRPDAVIGFHTGQCYHLREMDLRIPQDVAFAGLIVRPEDSWQRGISGIRFQDREVAETTISLLDQEIRKRIHGIPQHVLSIHIEPQWLVGQTMSETPGDGRR
jgi:LacI family transcriptional regulator